MKHGGQLHLIVRPHLYSVRQAEEVPLSPVVPQEVQPYGDRVAGPLAILGYTVSNRRRPARES